MERTQPHDRPKMNYACEACRAAKIKCQSGPQPGVCKRCHEFKRECVFRTGPRTRRPRGSVLREGTEPTMPTAGPSKTFSIDFEMPVMDEPVDEFEALRQRHERYLADFELDDDEDGEAQQARGSDMANTPSHSSEPRGSAIGSQRSKPLVNLGIKPQFNLDSASKLLAYFRYMLPNMPCLVLPEDTDVRSLARNSPFVLLAILAVTSCSTSLQGHSLYDEEFRKVFGLKFVAGGERSLELLQGLLIYCSWYPFHLQPKNKQAFQYLKMAVDIVNDLELDQEPDQSGQQPPNLDNIRAYLACFCAISTFCTIWGKPSTLRYGPQLARSADILEQNSTLEQDHHLVWLVRLQYIFEELATVQRTFHFGPHDQQSEVQRNIMRAGLEAQLRDFQARMPAECASTTTILLASLVIEALILVPPLINVSRRPSTKGPSEIFPSTHLLSAAQKVRLFFNHLTSLPAGAMRGFSSGDYGRVITATVMAYRISFPMVGICPEYDAAQGQEILDFGETLRALADDTMGAGAGAAAAPASADALYAFGIVLRAVRAKFEEKQAALLLLLEAASAATSSSSNSNSREWLSRGSSPMCPILNGSLNGHIPPAWTESTGESVVAADEAAAVVNNNKTPGVDAFMGPITQMGLGGGMEGDLWATMTMGWGGDEFGMEDMRYDETFGF